MLHARGQLRLGRPSRLLAVAALTAVAALALAGCASSTTGDPSASFFASQSAAPTTDSTEPSIDPSISAPAIVTSAPDAGPVSRPVRTLTPGAITTTNSTTVCALPLHLRSTAPRADQMTVFSEYGLDFDTQRSSYGLDYLVPLELGGAAVVTNLWPMALTGTGYHQKQKLTARLRTLVCTGALPLTQVQHDLETNWYALYQSYSAA
jgi:hypothetical protein